MRRRSWLPIALALAACLTPQTGLCQVTQAPTRVLSLYTLPMDSVWYTVSERIYRQALSDAFGDRLEYFYERLDVYNFPDPSYESDFEDYLVRKYQNRPVDLVLVSGVTAAAFAGRLQSRLANHPAIVFHGSFKERPVPKSTGYNLEFQLKESLDLALRVHPETRHVFVVCGAGAADKWYADEFRAKVPVPPPGVDFTHLLGLSVPALIKRLAALPPRSVVLLLSLTADGEGREYRISSAMGRLAAASTAPIYTYNGNQVGIGAFGRLLSTERVAEKTIELALRVLRGERAEDIPLTTLDASVDALDSRQLERWNVSEARVPPGVELRFREPGLFEQYRGYVLGALALLLLQTSLIAGLLIQRRNKQLAENSLRESEQRFRVMADTAPVMIWRSGPDQRPDFFNEPWLEFRGRSLWAEIGEGWTEGVHPDDIDRCQAVYSAAHSIRAAYRLEYRLRRADGQYRWVLDTGVPRPALDGAFLGYIGSCIDITERREAEEALRASEAALRQSHAETQDLAGRLITAQEAERARIARDLHDDISQQLAAISIAISGCKRLPGVLSSPELREALATLQQQTIGLAEDVRLLSHDLHPGVLKHAGLVDAVRRHCREFATQQSIDVAVEADPDLTIFDLATALSLYRIVQEALHNIAKHAGARQARVTMRQVEGEVQLAVSDDGMGFDLTKAREQGGGLGLRSIEERVRLVGGRLSIETALHRGTTVTVWVKTLASPVHELAGVSALRPWADPVF